MKLIEYPASSILVHSVWNDSVQH